MGRAGDRRRGGGRAAPWPPDATAEERSLRAFKDAIGYHAATAIGAALSEDGEEERYSAAAAVCDAYSAVLEHRPQELDPERTAITGAGVLRALRGR